jgi:hypothetical protein
MKRFGASVVIAVLLALSACAAQDNDPFGAPPKGVSPNCGPEHRYKFEERIKSAQDFAAFIRIHGVNLKDQYGNHWVRLDDFKRAEPPMTGPRVMEAPVDWTKVEKAVTVEKSGRRTVYGLKFEPLLCPGQGFTLKATDDGHVSLYGCCGK